MSINLSLPYHISHRYCWLLILINSIVNFSYAQDIRPETKAFNIQLFPGLGLYGKNPGSQVNYFSINVVSGYSFKNLAFELSGLLSINVADTRGLQISGLGNITGLNFLLSPFNDKVDEANLSGIQFSGVYNYVKNNVNGGQFSFLNQSKNLIGTQVGGINHVTGYTLGVQMAGWYNWSKGSMDGLQLSGLINETNGRLIGIQLASFNVSGQIEGKNSAVSPQKTGLQIGLANYAGKMHGYQVGIINIAGEMRGTQIGLINISSGGKVPVNKNSGTTIGLINIGLFESLSFYANESFLYNLELSTGSFKNSSIISDKTNKYFTGSLIYSWNVLKTDKKITAWSFGLNKFHYNRSSHSGYNERYFVKYGIFLTQYFVDNKIMTRDRVYGIEVDYGYKIFKKIGIYAFAGFTANFNFSNHSIDRNDIGALKFLDTNNYWSGFQVGIKIH